VKSMVAERMPDGLGEGVSGAGSRGGGAFNGHLCVIIINAHPPFSCRPSLSPPAQTPPQPQPQPHPNPQGLMFPGFMYLHTLFLTRGRLESTWRVLETFGGLGVGGLRGLKVVCSVLCGVLL